MNSRKDLRSDAEKSPLERILSAVLRLQWWLLLCLGVAGGLSYYLQPIPEPKELRALVAETEKQRDALQAEKQKLLDQIDWLKTEPEYLEIRARDKLNSKKQDEQVLRFQ